MNLYGSYWQEEHDLKEIFLTETDDSILPPPDGNIILTKDKVVVMTINTLMAATDNVVQITGLRNLLSGRKKKRRRKSADE